MQVQNPFPTIAGKLVGAGKVTQPSTCGTGAQYVAFMHHQQYVYPLRVLEGKLDSKLLPGTVGLYESAEGEGSERFGLGLGMMQ